MPDAVGFIVPKVSVWVNPFVGEARFVQCTGPQIISKLL